MPERSRSAFAPPAPRNLLILVGVAAEILLLLAANYLPPANAVLRTLRALGDVTLLLAPFALAMSGLDELAKILARRSGRRSARA